MLNGDTSLLGAGLLAPLPAAGLLVLLSGTGFSELPPALSAAMRSAMLDLRAGVTSAAAAGEALTVDGVLSVATEAEAAGVTGAAGAAAAGKSAFAGVTAGAAATTGAELVDGAAGTTEAVGAGVSVADSVVGSVVETAVGFSSLATPFSGSCALCVALLAAFREAMRSPMLSLRTAGEPSDGRAGIVGCFCSEGVGFSAVLTVDSLTVLFVGVSL